MNFAKFKASLKDSEPPEGLPGVLRALWYDAIGNWHKAHKIAQNYPDKHSSWVHAYLHRKEGDLENAAYWYDHAGKTPSEDSLEKEWELISTELLAEYMGG